jgi:hypothetical protein
VTRPEVRYVIPPHTRTVLCKGSGCLRPICWLATAGGKKMPVNPDGSPHWSDCPDSKEFKEKARLASRLAGLKAEAKR